MPSPLTPSDGPFDPYAEWLGIAPEERPVDHYRLLGLPRFENDAQRIQAAADQGMATVRKQQIGRRAPYTQQLLNELSSAKLCLLSPPAKADYDTRLIEATRAKMGLAPTGPAPPHVAASPWMHGASLPRIVIGRDDEEETAASISWVTVAVMFTGFALAAVGVWFVVFTRLSAQNVAAEQAKQPRQVVVIEQPVTPPPEIPLEENELQQDAAGNLTFVLDKATLQGEAARLDSPQGAVIGQLKTPNDGVAWKFRAISAGFFLVEVEYLAFPGTKGKVRLEIVSGNGESDARVYSLRHNEVEKAEIEEGTKDPAAARQQAMQTPIVDRYNIAIKRRGTCTLSLRPDAAVGGKEVLRVKSVTIRANRLKTSGQP